MYGVKAEKTSCVTCVFDLNPSLWMQATNLSLVHSPLQAYTNVSEMKSPLRIGYQAQAAFLK